MVKDLNLILLQNLYKILSLFNFYVLLILQSNFSLILFRPLITDKLRFNFESSPSYCDHKRYIQISNVTAQL